MSGSCVYQRWQEIQDTFIETQWGSRCIVNKSEGQTFSHHTVCLLSTISEEGKGDRAVEPRELLAQLDFKFVCLLVTFTYTLVR